jgi:hypothetical protein
VQPPEEQRKDEAKQPEPKHSASPGKGRNVAHPQEGAREQAAEPEPEPQRPA